MPVLKNIGLLATCDHSQSEIPHAAVAWEEARITWVGPEAALPPQLKTTKSFDAKAALVIPGLIDCHTHLAFGGWRADEFEERMKGASYLDIAKRGGGILSTVAKTRALTEDELFERCRQFLDGMLRLGVTTLECKSGYGLDLETELKILKAYRRLSHATRLDIIPTLLAAHTVPAEYRGSKHDYIRLICDSILPLAASEKLARFCDIFVEHSAFTADDARQILRLGQTLGLKSKLHVDQLSDGSGAALAAELGAVSADHLEHISDTGIAALKRSGTTAVLLPLATVFTKEKPLNARRLIDAGVRVAVATDFNPGTAPSYHLPLAMLLSCTLCGLTPREALRAATINAASALEEEDRLGSIEIGKQADFAVLDSSDPAQWLYHFRPNDCRMTFKKGELLWQA